MPHLVVSGAAGVLLGPNTVLLLVVAAERAGATAAAERIKLVDEYDAGRRLPRLLKQIAHARCANAHEHLDELGAGDREEWHAGLAGYCACQKRLARARRADQQNTLRNARAEPPNDVGSRRK